jgi:hypothetical protein
MLDAQLGGDLVGGDLLNLDGGGIDALVDQRSPLACDRPGALQRHRVGIYADHPPCRRGSRREPGIEDKGDLTGLAASGRVRVLGVADPDAEAGDAAVP